MTGWRDEYADDQFAQAEARGFNPYAGPNGKVEDPPRPSRGTRFAPPMPVRFWDLTDEGRSKFMAAAAEAEGVAEFADLPPEVRARYYEATWTPGR